MADVTRRAALAAPVAALAAAAGIAGSSGALAASTTSSSLVTGTDADALRAVGRMGGIGYATTRDRYEMPIGRAALGRRRWRGGIDRHFLFLLNTA